jgi:glycosyltransferase involved in cell wall biosynthesis
MNGVTMDGTCVHVNDVSGVGSALVDILNEAGYSAALVEPAKRPPEGSGRRTGLRSNNAYFVVNRSRVALRLRRNRSRVALVHVHYGMFGPIGLLSGSPFLLHFHGGDLIVDDDRRHWHAIHRLAAHKAAHCLVSTPDLLQYGDTLSVPLKFLPNPVRFANLPQVGGGGVVFAAKLDHLKGVERFLPAAVELAHRGRQVTVLGFGSEAERWVGRLAKLRALGARVVPDRLSSLAFNHLLESADVVVGQFLVGAMGMTELDAMARGRPVVTRFDYPGVYGHEPAVLWANDAGQIVGAVERLMEDDQLRRRVGAAGRRWVRAEHNPDLVRDLLLETYAEVLHAPSDPIAFNA